MIRAAEEDDTGVVELGLVGIPRYPLMAAGGLTF